MSSNTQQKCPVGSMFLVDNPLALDEYIQGDLERPLQLGDVVYCLREYPNLKGTYEYMLVNLRCTETVYISTGLSCASDYPMGTRMPFWVKREELADFVAGKQVIETYTYEGDERVTLYAKVAAFLKALPQRAYAERLAHMPTGSVLFGNDAAGKPLFPGGCAMLLAMSEAADPLCTLHVKEDGNAKRIRRKLSTLMTARLAEDAGFREEAPCPSRDVLNGPNFAKAWSEAPTSTRMAAFGHFEKGTILALRYPPTQYSAFGDSPVRNQRHVLVTSAAKARSKQYGVKVFSPGRGASEALMDARSFDGACAMN